MTSWYRCGLLLALVGLCVSWALAAAGRGRHTRVFAVPTPGKVTIDGQFNDWDLSGRIWIYVQQETAELGSAHYAMMYDADALYLGAEVRDSTPLRNRTDPQVAPQQAWKGDVCQLFLALDPALGYPMNISAFTKDAAVLHQSPVSTLYLWYYTDRQEPCLAMYRGMQFTTPARPDLGANGAVAPQHFQAAYRLTADGRGFTFEYRIPWATLGLVTVPKAGDILAGVVCVFFSNESGMGLGGAGTAYDVMATSGFPWQETKSWGKIIFAENGHLPRELVEDGVPPEKPLPLSFTFDMPRDGEASIALLDAAGRPIRHVVTQATLKAGATTIRWDGMDDKGQALSAGTYQWKGIVHDPITTKFLLSVHNSGQPPYKKEDGTGGWGGDHTNPSSVCAVGDKILLLWPGGEAGWGLIRTDLQGKKQWGVNEGAQELVSDGKRIYLMQEAVAVRDFADGRRVNFGNGQPHLAPPAGEGPARATGLALFGQTLYVAYAGRDGIGVYDAASGNLRACWAVPAPGRLAVTPAGRLLAISGGTVVAVTQDSVTPVITTHLDAPSALVVDAAGRIYVSNRGARQNVSIFAADGVYQKSIGKLGGRPPLGIYDGSGMLEPGGISVDRLGRLWVAEVLDSPRRHSVWDTHTGALVKEYFGGSEYSTGVTMDPQRPDEVYCHNVIWRVNLDTGAWAPHSTIWRGSDPDEPSVPNTRAGTGPPFHVITATNGRQYAWSETPPTLWMRTGETMVPLLQTSSFKDAKRYPALAALRAAVRDQYSTFTWQDSNADAKVQAEELSRPTNWSGFAWVDADLTVYAANGVCVKPVRIEADGRPVYDFGRLEKLALPARAFDLWVDPQDRSLYTIGVKGTGIARWSAQGTLLWNYPKVTGWHNSLNLPPAKPGEIWGVTRPLGVAGEITGVMTYFGPVNLFTRDGLFVAQIMNGKQGWADRYICESFYGNLVWLANGRTLLLAGDQDGRVTEVFGLDTIRRFTGRYELAEADVNTAQRALAEYMSLKAKAQPLSVVRGKAQLGMAPTVARHIDDTHAFQARVAYDETNLYLHYEVDSPAGLINAHPDPQTVFRGGNCLDLQLATDPTADPKRKTPAPGDVRLLVTRQANKPFAVLYRPKARRGAEEPITFTSPTGQERFDAIAVVSDAIALDYKARTGGFTATLTVPLAVLGWTPPAGTTVRMDVGYIFGVPTGNLTERRAYWSNNSFTANVVNDIPHESRLEPTEWGTATVE